MDKNGIIDSVEEVARHFGKSVRTVQRWVSIGMPRMLDGRFDLLAITAWRRTKKGQDAPVMSGSNDQVEQADPAPVARASGDKDWWDKESKKYQARLRELDYRKRAGELIELRQVEDMFVARIQAVKQAMIALERSLPTELIACRSEREMSAVIHKVVRGILEAFSRPLPAHMRRTDPEDSQESGSDDPS